MYCVSILSVLILALAMPSVYANRDLLDILSDIKSKNGAFTMKKTSGPSTTPSSLTIPTPRDCQEIWDGGYRHPGVFTIFPDGFTGTQVWCEHSLTDTATVFQRRQYGNVDFAQSWQSYRNGFGAAQSDYWMGLNSLYHLTNTGIYKLSIALQDWQGVTEYMVYNTFTVANETQRYRLSIGGAQGYITDDMSYSNGMYFSTYDRPDTYSCAYTQHAGWWYNYCAFALLNGRYYYGGPYAPTGGLYDGIYWKDWRGYDYSLKFVSMALVRKY